MDIFWQECEWLPTEPFLYSASIASLYPSLTPCNRSYNMGLFAISREVGFGGGQVKFLHSNRVSNLRMQLQYKNLGQAESSILRDHYRAQQGSYVGFELPVEIWSGQSNTANVVPIGTRWRYDSPLEEQQKRGGYVDVQVSLITITTWLPSIEPLPGLSLGINAIWISGPATQTSAINLQVVALWSSGVATGESGEDGFAEVLFWNEDQFTTWR